MKQHKPLAEVKKMIDSLAETLEEPAITKKVLLYFLDELTLHPHVIEILAELKKCELNGFLMTMNGDQKYHDCFTGSKGLYQKTPEATPRANSYGYSCDGKEVWRPEEYNGI